MLVHAQGKALIADTGYDSDRTIENARKLGMLPVIQPHPSRKKRRRINRQLYANGYRVECLFHSLKTIPSRRNEIRQDFLLLSRRPSHRLDDFMASVIRDSP